MSKLPLTTDFSGVLKTLSAAEAANLDERGIPKHLGSLQRKVQLAGYDKEANTVTMAVSSSTPVDRYFGSEVLSHEAGAINMDRLKAGIPLLFNHDVDAHLGRSQSFKQGDPLHVTCRFGTNPLAIEKAGDVDSGILVDVSIGYTVEEWEITENAKTGERTYTATKWTLLEVSLVTVPADPTVGVGRSSDPAPNIRSFRTIDEAGNDVVDDTPTDAMAEAERAAAAEATRLAELPEPDPTPFVPPTPATQRTAIMENETVDLAAQEETRKAGLRKLHSEYPTHFNARSLEVALALSVPETEIRSSIAKAVIESSQREVAPTMADEIFGSMSARELAAYSMRDAYAAAINNRNPGTFKDKGVDGIVRDVDQQLRKLATERGIDGLGPGLIVPSLGTRGVYLGQQARTIASGGNAGTATNFTVVERDPIELLRAKVAALRLGATFLTGLKGKIQMPKQTGAATSNWVTEGTAATQSDLTLGDFVMSPNRLTMANSYYRDFFAQSALAIDPLLAGDRYAVLQRALDTAAVAGTGSAPVPLGLLNQSGLAAVLAGTTRAANGTVTGGAGGVPITYVDLNNLEAAISTANGDIGTLGWLTTPKVRGAARSTPKIPGTASEFIWPDSGQDANGLQTGPLGYKAMVTSAPYLTGFTANSVSNLHAILLGVWDQLLIGDWGLSEVIVDNLTGGANAEVKIYEHGYYDCNVRHIESFAACTSALPS